MKRIFHTWDKWECYPAGLYETNPPNGMTADEARTAYATFLKDSPRFRKALAGVLRDWPNSTEHYLTNERMNRIAWLGQAAVCYDMGIPQDFRSGYFQMTKTEQAHADRVALNALNEWLIIRGEPFLPDVDSAGSRTQANLY